VREWYLRLKARMKELRAKALEAAGGANVDPDLVPVIPSTSGKVSPNATQ